MKSEVLSEFKNMSAECCPLQQDPCNGLVVDIFPPIVLVVISGSFVQILLKFLPETQKILPSWAHFLIKLLIQLGVGLLIQMIAGVRNMWKTPSSAGILASLFFMIFAPLFLPTVLKAL